MQHLPDEAVPAGTRRKDGSDSEFSGSASDAMTDEDSDESGSEDVDDSNDDGDDGSEGDEEEHTPHGDKCGATGTYRRFSFCLLPTCTSSTFALK